MNGDKIIYHGSHQIIKEPIFGAGNPKNDYGLGFYCTESLNLAKEWACDQYSGGYASKYSLSLTGLKVLNLNDERFTIVHWLSVLLQNRAVALSNAVEREGVRYIIDHFPVDFEHADVIIGYRADDSYFSFARDFLSNTITVDRLSAALRLGNLGEQIVLKTPLAFSRLKFLGYEVAPQEVFYPLRAKRDEDARKAYRDYRNGQPFDGIFLIDIIRGGIEENDPRLR